MQASDQPDLDAAVQACRELQDSLQTSANAAARKGQHTSGWGIRASVRANAIALIIAELDRLRQPAPADDPRDAAATQLQWDNAHLLRIPPQLLRCEQEAEQLRARIRDLEAALAVARDNSADNYDWGM